MKVFTPSGYEWKGTRLARFIERHGYGSLDQLQEDAERDAPVFWDRVVAEVASGGADIGIIRRSLKRRNKTADEAATISTDPDQQ